MFSNPIEALWQMLSDPNVKLIWDETNDVIPEKERPIPSYQQGGKTTQTEKIRQDNTYVPPYQSYIPDYIRKHQALIDYLNPFVLGVPDDNSIYLKDTRKIHPVTGKKINPNRDLKTGWYDFNIIRDIVGNAISKGLDPRIALSVSLAEEGLGSTDLDIGHGGDNVSWTVNPDTVYAHRWVYSHIDKMVDNLLRYKQRSEARGDSNPINWLQRYNGVGMIGVNTEKDYHNKTGRSTNRFYGIDVTRGNIDAGKLKPYGKTVMSLVPLFDLNETIRRYIDAYNEGVRYKKDKIKK
jgi:hypothetical protein